MASPKSSSSGRLCRTRVRSRKNGSAFVPNDLLVVKKPDAQQAVQNLARELTGVPDVGHLETRKSAKASDQSARVSPEIEVSV